MLTSFVVLITLIHVLSVAGNPPQVCVAQDATGTTLTLCGGEPFHSTTEEVVDQSLIAVPDSAVLLILWNERSQDGAVTPWYAISLDGATFSVVTDTSYELLLLYQNFDPGISSVAVQPPLAADESNELYLVQFVTQPLTELRAGLTAAGVSLFGFVPNHAYLTRMSATAKSQVEALPYVRAVVPFDPAFRLEHYLRENLDRAEELFPSKRYRIMVLEPGISQKKTIAEFIISLGGIVESLPEGGRVLEARMTPDQLLQVARRNDVQFIERSLPVAPAMNIVRDLTGADYVATVPGTPFTGAGVRGEVMDFFLDSDQPEFFSQTGTCIGGPNDGDA